MTLTTEERAELDALKATVKQLQTQLAAKAMVPSPGAGEKAASLSTPTTGIYQSYHLINPLPYQGAPVVPEDPDALVIKPKVSTPIGKATSDQAFVDPKGRPFDEPLPPDSPSITPASGRV